MNASSIYQSIEGQIEATVSILAKSIVVKLSLSESERADVEQNLRISALMSLQTYRPGAQAPGTFVTQRLVWAKDDLTRKYLSARRKVYLCIKEEPCPGDSEDDEPSLIDRMPDGISERDIVGNAEVACILECLDDEERTLALLLDAGHSMRSAAARMSCPLWHIEKLLDRIREKLKKMDFSSDKKAPRAEKRK